LYISARLEDVWEEYDIRNGAFWLAEFLQSPESKQFPFARARALCAQCRLLLWLGKYPQAQRAAEESLALFYACNDRLGEIDALTLQGASYFLPGEREEGVKLLEQALTLSQSLGDIWRQAKAYYFLGWDQIGYQRSFAYWEKAVELFSEVGDQRSQANLLSLIALYRVLNGDIGLAQEYLDKAMRLFPLDKMIVDRDFLMARSIIALEQGNYEQAHSFLQEVLAQSEKSGNRMDYLWAQVRSGHLALHEGNISEARKVFIETAEEFRKNKETSGVVFTLEGMAELFTAAGNPTNTARLIGWADATRKEINNSRPLLEQRDVDKVIAACISKMGEVAFADAFDEGQVMTMDEAVALALNEQYPPITGYILPGPD
jgi:tetratricopeptide (TPR) repeat protein